MISEEQLAEAEHLISEASSAPWQYGTAPHDPTVETKAEYVTKGLLPEGEATLWTCWAENPTPEDGFAYVIPALTGDGPKSESNARFIAASRELVPELIAEVRRLNAAIADAVALNPHAPTCNTWYQGDCNCWHGVLGDPS